MFRKVGHYEHVIAFYEAGQPFDWMANTFRGKPVNIDGVTWPTTEHYFQAMKFPGDTVNEITYRQAIWNYSGPFSQFPQFARDTSTNLGLTFDSAAWDRNDTILDGRSHAVMRKALKAKIDQHPDLKQALLALPSDTIIIEAIPSTHQKPDMSWGDGGNGYGYNHLGILWMELRLQVCLPDLPTLPIRQSAYQDNQEFHRFRTTNFLGKSLYDPMFATHTHTPVATKTIADTDNSDNEALQSDLRAKARFNHTVRMGVRVGLFSAFLVSCVVAILIMASVILLPATLGSSIGLVAAAIAIGGTVLGGVLGGIGGAIVAKCRGGNNGSSGDPEKGFKGSSYSLIQSMPSIGSENRQDNGHQYVETYDRHGNFTGNERVLPPVETVEAYDRHGNFTGNEVKEAPGQSFSFRN